MCLCPVIPGHDQSMRNLKDKCINDITDERKKITSKISSFCQPSFLKVKSLFVSSCVILTKSCQNALLSEASPQNKLAQLTPAGQTRHTRWNVSSILQIYLPYPSGGEPTQSILKLGAEGLFSRLEPSRGDATCTVTPPTRDHYCTAMVGPMSS